MSEKTCGNCEYRHSGLAMCDARPYDSEGCNFWKESRNSLEQRYEKLEQVAREMFRYISGETMCLAPVHRFSNKLTECGVSVDD